MRISSISIAQPKNVYYNQNLKRSEATNFKGWGATGTLIGAAAGGILTAMSGGALFWTIPALSGLSGIGGDIYEHNRNGKSSDDNDYDAKRIGYNRES